MPSRKLPSDDQLRDAFTDVGDALQRAVVLSTDRLQSVLDDAVRRGRMTRRDAEELASNLVAQGREQAQELRAEVDSLARSLPGRVADKVADTATPLGKLVRRATGADETDPPEGDAPHAHASGASAEPTTAPASAPVPDPSALTARELTTLTATLGPDDLKTLRDREAAGKARATVLTAIDRKLAS